MWFILQVGSEAWKGAGPEEIPLAKQRAPRFVAFPKTKSSPEHFKQNFLLGKVSLDFLGCGPFCCHVFS